MANVLLTEKCVRKCPYCFAKEYIKDSQDNLLSWENLIYITDFFEASNEKRLSLLGGEPTLHSEFVDFVLYLHQRKFSTTVFTSGILSEKTLETSKEYLSQLSVDNLSFVCNYNHPSLSTDSESKRIDIFLRTFSKHISLSYNLYQKDFDFKFLFDTIDQYGLKKHIRLGLAQPIPGQRNECLNLNEIRNITEKIREQIDDLEKHRISISFDCGMPLCIFSNDDLGRLYKLNKGRIRFSCGPAIDIGTDMQVWACFPLANYNKKSLYDFDNVEEIKQYFSEQNRNLRAERKGIFEECQTCVSFEEKLCSGGCVAHFISDNNIKG
jgi:radical SAM protein with 4Fe4S-binding SPASM domain